MHKTAGLCDPAAAFPLPTTRDDVQERREANRAVAASAIGLAATGITELLMAVLTGSVGLLGDAIHNLSDVSTSAVVFLGGYQSVRKLVEHGATSHVALGIVAAALGIAGNQVVARTSSSPVDASNPRCWWPTPGTPGSMPCPRWGR